MDREGALRSVRILQSAFLVAVLMLALVGEQVSPLGPALPRGARLGLAIFAFVALFFLAVVRQRVISPAQSGLRQQSPASPPMDPAEETALLARWRAGYMVFFAVCESVGLCGLLLRLLGGTLQQALPFYVLAGLTLLALGPGGNALAPWEPGAQ